MDKTQLLALAQKYLEGTASEEEIRLLHEWYDGADDDEIEMVFTNRQESQQALGNRLYVSIKEKMRGRRARRMVTLKWTAAASVAALLIITSAYFFTQNKRTQPPAVVQTPVPAPTVKDVLPGGDKARLMLADGKVIILEDIKDGTITNEEGIAIRKEKGQVIYDASHAQAGKEITYNTIVTPRGGQYQVVLPDGSKVWLNAASLLRFPTAFAGSERKVGVKGEAYFEVAKNKAQPFVVDVNGLSRVEVLGTHFNIMAYDDEKDTRTTLLEGSVKINETVLKPGEQSILTNDSKLTVNKNINLEDIIAWKNGLFAFNNTDIQTIMRQISRWYNVDIAYEGQIGARYFTGEIARNMNVSAVLKILETAGVHFRLDGGSKPGDTKIVVLP